MVYFICGISDSCVMVKIGHANDVQKRIRDLQVGSPLILGLIMAENGGSNREKQLHAYFRDSRCHGEWFALSQRMVDYVMDSTCHFLPSFIMELASDQHRLESFARILGWTVDEVLDELERVHLEAEIMVPMVAR